MDIRRCCAFGAAVTIVVFSAQASAGGDIPTPLNTPPVAAPPVNQSSPSQTTPPKRVVVPSFKRTAPTAPPLRPAASGQVRTQSTVNSKGDTTIQIIVPDSKTSDNGKSDKTTPSIEAYSSTPASRSTLMNMLRTIFGNPAGYQCATDMSGGTNDLDGDGHDTVQCGGDDCDDNDPARYAGAVELCDAAAKDEDCDVTTVGVRDTDADGYIDYQCTNTGPDRTVYAGDDCNDANRFVNPGAADFCDNGVDNDCNGIPDEGPDRVVLYRDDDGDGFGTRQNMVEGCARQLSDGWSMYSTDCDDANRNKSPGAGEIRGDGLDNNCDGNIDEALSR